MLRWTGGSSSTAPFPTRRWCGVRVTGYDDINFGGTQYVRITGPTSIASVSGAGAWSSMIIERDPSASCP